MKLYRNFATQSDIDEQYNAGASVEGYQQWMQWYQRSSAEYRKQTRHSVLAYGPTISESLEVYPAAVKKAPLVVFIHGGYWRSGAASDFSFVARGLNTAGYTVAVIDYALCPSVGIEEITRQSRASIAWLYRNAGQFNADPEKITVLGHSAGGQQVAMLLQTDWTGHYELPHDIITAAIPVSGLFDLRPLRHSYLQPVINLSHETVYTQSPLLQEIRSGVSRILVTVGALESDEFHRQSESYAERASAAGYDVDLWVQPDRHHFDVIAGLHDAESEFVNRICAIAG